MLEQNNPVNPMKRSKYLILAVLLIFSLPYAYGGCVVVFSSGDINRDIENEHDGSSVGFIGIASRAVISATNAEDLVAGAFAGGLTSGTDRSSGSKQDIIDAQIGNFSLLRFPLALGEALRKIEIAQIPISLFESNVQIESGTYDDSCGGGFSYKISLDRSSAEFNGNLSFANYCDQDIEISGEAEVNGTFELVTQDFATANFTFDNLTDGFLTLDGEISITLLDSPILATLTAFGEDNASGQVYWINNYSMNITESAGYVEIEIFGTFYHPQYGFVNVTTTEPFVVHDLDEWPTSGQIVIQGAKDTKAKLTALDHLRYGVEADLNGNGRYDWDSGILYWFDN